MNCTPIHDMLGNSRSYETPDQCVYYSPAEFEQCQHDFGRILNVTTSCHLKLTAHLDPIIVLEHPTPAELDAVLRIVEFTAHSTSWIEIPGSNR